MSETTLAVSSEHSKPAGAATSSAPIGVFDSGLGGLTVAHAIMRQLPGESLVYFGDTARVPYGPKSPDTVRRYSREITSFLLEQGVKAIVVACNTATAHALPVLRDELDVPVIGVVEPGARAAVRATRTGHIGVIGTAGTIRSEAYVRAIRAESADATVIALPCPLFVPLVEEGWTTHDATRLIAREYLAPFMGDAVDTLVLGCTHYPLLKPMIAEIVGPGVRLIDSAEETAADTRRMLAANELESRASDAAYRFIASDDPQQFLTLGRRFFGASIERVEIRTFG
ncbi:MAG: Glutamate racemase [Gemmatimonadetes bacterium]|nr:Glutamate racemase [Gemmatimonadota bacterium]